MAEAMDNHPDSQTPGFDDSMPAGGHALEVAARAGFGPLSPLAQEVWHGQGVPCVSCGQLARRDSSACDYCGQDLSEEMIQKMRQHAGPWFVLEHVRPFPGVSLERVIRQIRRGLITETSIVRGPSNDYQWRFAVETPGLCRYFGKCWCCHGIVTLSDTYCPHCLHFLSFEKPRPGVQVPGFPEGKPGSEIQAAAEIGAGESAGSHRVITAQHVAQAVARGVAPNTTDSVRSAGVPSPSRPHGIHSPLPGGSQVGEVPNIAGKTPVSSHAAMSQTPDLAQLSAAVRRARTAHPDAAWDAPRVGGVNVGWFAALVIIAAIIALLIVSRARSVSSSQREPSLPVMPALSTPQNQPPKAQEPQSVEPPAKVPDG